MLKLLVFDLDGTLADTREDLSRSVNHALRLSGLPSLSLERVMTKVGNGGRHLIRSSVEESRLSAQGAGSRSPTPVPPDLEDKVLADFLRHYGDHCLDSTSVYPGVASALARLDGYRKAVLTNKPGAPAARILEGLGLARHFEMVIGGDNPHGRKPDPSALAWMISALEASPGSTAMIGDGVQDARAARGAGASIIGFLNGIAPRADLLAEVPDAAVESMDALPEAVAGLEARLGARS